MPGQVQQAAAAAPTRVKVVGDVGNVDIPGLPADELREAMKQFEELTPQKAAAEIKEQTQIYTMVLQGGRLTPEETKLAKEALKETNAIAKHVLKTGELPADRYAELALAVGYFAGKVFEDS